MPVSQIRRIIKIYGKRKQKAKDWNIDLVHPESKTVRCILWYVHCRLL
nr:MAG TPA: hypothetical protein [Caudoviricetes sp.]